MGGTVLPSIYQHPDSQVLSIYITHTWRVRIYYGRVIYFTLSTSRNYVPWAAQCYHPFFSASEQRDTRYILSILHYYTAGTVKYIILWASPWG